MAHRTWLFVSIATFLLAGCSSISGPGSSSSQDGSSSANSKQAAVPTVLILDASGSMNEADAPGPRIDAAKAAAQGLIDAVPNDATIGLTTYGTGTGSSEAEQAAGCVDVKVLLPLGPLNRDEMRTQISSLRPSGYTPISLALGTAVSQLPVDGRPQAIVLVSDGEDTCGAPPCDAAKEAKQSHPGLTISTVGFKTEGLASDQLNCIATATGGLFVQAQNASQLAARLMATQNVAVAQGSLSSDGFNGITLGSTLADIRAAHPDFPTVSTSGSAAVVYRDCDFGFVDGVLDSIAPHGGGRTIDGVQSGTQLSRATELYGKPLQSITNQDGTHTVVYSADPKTDAAYQMRADQYAESAGTVSGLVKTVVLCRCAAKSAAPAVERGITFGGYADVLGGMTPDQVAALGWAVTPTGGGDGCSEFRATRSGVELGLTATAGTNVIGSIAVTPSVPLTARLTGDHATYAEVVAAYPDADIAYEPPKPGPRGAGLLLVVSKANPTLAISFTPTDYSATQLDNGSNLQRAVGGTRAGLEGAFGCAH